ncbi:cupin domain-containing protein [Egbenema bharatensis]|uniref:cupin domain-containing protein n=1 Tax=Egbenema bharatensis TaxID=3463334 RepID=UPI003A899E50
MITKPMITLKTYPLQPKIFEDFSQGSFPLLLQTWQDHPIGLSDVGTHFGFVYQGFAHLSFRGMHGTESYRLRAGMYFSLPGKGAIGSAASSGIVFTRLNYRGMFSLGGPIEAQGRLAYIDGGTSSLLIPPVLLGDPCLNVMYFPPHVDQTLHTHPSDRIGIVVAGASIMKTPQSAIPVESGTIFLIPAHYPHKFCTSDSPFTVVVFHPDSDTGYTHTNHPMLQRTMVDGISAAELPEIQTRLRFKPE